MIKKDELRSRAEKIALEKAARLPEQLKALSPEEIRQMIHELLVHQIELEMQNEELRRTQEELDAARVRYFDLYNLAPVGYCILSLQGLILETNLTAATLLGSARGKLVKQPISRFILKEDQNNYYLHRKQLFNTGKQQSFELRMVKADGTAFWGHLEATVAQDEKGEPVCHIVLTDITGLKRSEAEKDKLESQNRQLQKAESLGRMAGAIAHRFNNQLQAVMGNLEMALDENQGEDPFDRISTAMQAAHMAAEVSTLMLTYLGQTTGKREPLDLSEVCRRYLPMLQVVIKKNVELKTDLPSPGPIVNANENQIQQVLTNLLSNAREAVGKGKSSIKLSVKTVSPVEISSAYRFPVDWQPQKLVYTCLEVTDAGCGIEDKDIEKIFDPFFSSNFIGRGLGLSVVLGIVRAHSGAVTVESEPGRGSVFRVFLPVSEEKFFVQPDKAAKSPEIICGGTVLLVEDEELVRNMTATMLTYLGFTVIEAYDGVEALDVFPATQR